MYFHKYRINNMFCYQFVFIILTISPIKKMIYSWDFSEIIINLNYLNPIINVIIVISYIISQIRDSVVQTRKYRLFINFRRRLFFKAIMNLFMTVRKARSNIIFTYYSKSYSTRMTRTFIINLKLIT